MVFFSRGKEHSKDWGISKSCNVDWAIWHGFELSNNPQKSFFCCEDKTSTQTHSFFLFCFVLFCFGLFCRKFWTKKEKRTATCCSNNWWR
jgi:hypothetical protein